MGHHATDSGRATDARDNDARGATRRELDDQRVTRDNEPRGATRRAIDG